MLSSLRAYTDWLFRSPKPTELRILLVGPDDAGKTTLLNRWKHGKFIDLPPSYMGGFEVQSVEYPRKCTWTVWDITLGSAPIKKLLYHYFQNTQAVLYVHDCDRQLDDTLSTLHYFVSVMLESEVEILYIVPNKQDTLPSEKSRGLAHNLQELYRKELAEYPNKLRWKVLDFKISAKTGEGVWKILDDMRDECHSYIKPSAEAPIKAPPPTDTISNPSLVSPIEKESSVGPSDRLGFWLIFAMGYLPLWDHHFHLKAAYMLVLEYLRDGKSLSAMSDTFLTYLKRLRHARPEKFQYREHRTMTIFWLTQLQVAIRDFKVDTKLNRYLCWHDFYDVLLHSPHLKDARLWSAYYTEDHLFGNEDAWDKWVPPNLQPFRILSPLFNEPPGLPMMDEDHDRILRFAFAVTQHKHTSATEGGDTMQQALSMLQATTIRLRAKNAAIPPYSETQATFWIHVVRACLQTLEHSESTGGIDPSRLSFAEFITLFDLEPTLWKRYYTQSLWYDIKAGMKFVSPNKKSLPHAIRISAHADPSKVVGSQAEGKGLEKCQNSLGDALLATEQPSVDLEVPSCCNGTFSCDQALILPILDGETPK